MNRFLNLPKMKLNKLNGNRCSHCGKTIVTKSLDGASLIIPKYIKVLNGGRIIAKCKSCGGFVQLPASIFTDKKVKYVVKNSN